MAQYQHFLGSVSSACSRAFSEIGQLATAEPILSHGTSPSMIWLPLAYLFAVRWKPTLASAVGSPAVELRRRATLLSRPPARRKISGGDWGPGSRSGSRGGFIR